MAGEFVHLTSKYIFQENRSKCYGLSFWNNLIAFRENCIPMFICVWVMLSLKFLLVLCYHGFMRTPFVFQSLGLSYCSVTSFWLIYFYVKAKYSLFLFMNYNLTMDCCYALLCKPVLESTFYMLYFRCSCCRSSTQSKPVIDSSASVSDFVKLSGTCASL